MSILVGSYVEFYSSITKIEKLYKLKSEHDMKCDRKHQDEKFGPNKKEFKEFPITFDFWTHI